MFQFVKSDGIKIELTESQKLQLSSQERIQAALIDEKVVSYDIYTLENELIGFAMLRNCGDGWFLWNYAIDFRFQNRQYGQKALFELCEFFKLHYNAKWITTTYKFGNEIAQRMYKKVGFTQTDIINDNDIHEVNMIMDLCKTNQGD